MLVLDANILIRAVLGRRVRTLLTESGNKVEFFAADVAFDEAREHLRGVLERRGAPVAPAIEYLSSLGELIQTVEVDTYAGFEMVLGSAWLEAIWMIGPAPRAELYPGL